MPRFWFLLGLFLSVWAGTTGADDERLSVLFDRGQWRRAAALAQKQLESSPHDVEALRILARIRTEQGQFDEAASLAQRAVAAAPNNPDAHFALAMVSGYRAQRAPLIHKPGHAKKFKKEAEVALSLDPNHRNALQGLIQFHRQAPGIAGGDKKKGAELSERLMKVDPTQGLLLKSNNAFDDGDSVGGERDLRQAVSVQNKPEARLALASYLSARWRKPDEAFQIAQDVAASEPWRTGAWSLMAISQATRKQYAEMDATLARAETALQGILAPHYQAARTLIFDGGDAAKAEALLRRYLAVEPEIGQPSHAAARWRLGLALEREGRKADAIKEVETAVKMDPKMDNAKKDLQRMKK